MISKNQIKFINALQLKKNREEHQLFVAEGVKIVLELLQSAIEVKQLLATAAWIKANEDLIKSPAFEIMNLKEEELKKVSNLTTPNEVIAVCSIPAYKLEPEKLASKLSLVLDDIRDPGNLGTIIRVADWFGIEEVICSNDSVDAFNFKVVQSSMGSIARVQIHYTGLEDFFRGLKEKIPVYGAMLNGENIYKQSLQGSGILLIGNESKGISDKLIPFVSRKITIPPYISSSGERSESLNAAIATAIICSEFRRRLGEY